MTRLNYFRVFGFLAFMGSALLATVFHYPVFTFCWFLVMIIFSIALMEEKSEIVISALAALAYIPIALIYVSKDSLSQEVVKGDLMSSFAWFLLGVLVVEFIIALGWCDQ